MAPPLMAPPAKKTSPAGLGCLAVLGFIVLVGVYSPKKPADAVEDTPVASSETPALGGRRNVADQIEVVGTDVDWRPPANNPNGMDLAWVTTRLRNKSNIPVGVVWASVWVYDANGNKLGGTDQEIVYYAEKGVRGTLAPGAVWMGDSQEQGEPYGLEAPDGGFAQKQPVRVEVEVFGAYENPSTGTRGQNLDAG